MFTRKEDELEMNPYMPVSGSTTHSGSATSAAPEKETNIISRGTLIQGDLHCDGDIRIDGEVKGTIHSRSKVMIGPDGLVDGDVECVQAEVLGRVKGSLKVQDHLYLRGNAKMEGDVLTTHFEMEPSVRFNGKCTMQDKVELSAVKRGEKADESPVPIKTGSIEKPATDKIHGEKENKSPNGIFQKQGV
jgi:cytoskeletal protein CcmA (bactofilin family)